VQITLLKHGEIVEKLRPLDFREISPIFSFSGETENPSLFSLFVKEVI
jgi:hypothetical protein